MGLPKQRMKVVIVAILIGIIVGATTLALLSWDSSVRHRIPDNWIQINESPSETGPEWSRISAVWIGFNGFHLFLKFEWSASMEGTSHIFSTDYSGNNISAYFDRRGVDVGLMLGGYEAIVGIRQLKNGYWTMASGVQAIARQPLTSDETTKEIIVEVPIPPIGFGNSWLDFVEWQEVQVLFEIVSNAGVSHVTNIPRNVTHLILADGNYQDWASISNLTITEGIIPNATDFGAITNVSALFYSEGLAFMMSTHDTFQYILSAYPQMNLEAYLFMGIEAFQETPILTEQSYNPNLWWTSINGTITRTNIIYHLWDSPNSTGLFEEETFELNNTQWAINTIAELTLLTHQIQPLLTLHPTDYYSLHYSIILTYWQQLP